MAKLGTLRAVEYSCSHEGERRLCRHEYAADAAPSLESSASGLRTTGGNFSVTARGIEDRNVSRVENVTNLRESGDRRKSARMKHNNALAKLGNYVGPQKYTNFARDFVIVGGTAALATGLGAYGMRRTSLTYAQRGGVQALVGLGAGIALSGVAAPIALGLAVSGVVSGLNGALSELELRGYIGPRVRETTVTTPAVTAGAGVHRELYAPARPGLPQVAGRRQVAMNGNG